MCLFVFGVSDVRERRKSKRWRRCSCKLTGLPRRPRPRLRHRRRGPSSAPAASYAFGPLPPSPDRPVLIAKWRNDRLESIARSPGRYVRWWWHRIAERMGGGSGSQARAVRGVPLRKALISDAQGASRKPTSTPRRPPVALRRGEKSNDTAEARCAPNTTEARVWARFSWRCRP